MNGGELAASVRRELEGRCQEMVDLLGSLVRIESPSDDRAALDRMAQALTERFAEFGEIETIDPGQPPRGKHLRLSLEGMQSDLPHAVALCHYDTVWDLGTIERIPFHVDAEGVARGPGCFDMKAGMVVLYYALAALRAHGLAPRRRLSVLFTSDEEVGSPTSRPLIEETAREAGAAFVLESPLPGGTLKTARKGTGDYLVRIEGRAAHAGVEPQKGISAVQELAHQISALHALNDYGLGTTVNVGVVQGGTRPNVVAAEAEAYVDVRVETLAEAERIDRLVRGLQPVLAGARLSIEGGLNRPPMERSPGVVELFGRAQRIAAAMGVALAEGSTGGGSDGNFTAALAPTLDGLGVDGKGGHTHGEQLYVSSLVPRARLLLGLFETLR